MRIIDNINELWGDSLKKEIKAKSKIRIAASCFSIYAYEALKKELDKIDSLEFIFTEPAFNANGMTDKMRKERREFFIPKQLREKNLYGSEFEIKLKNKLTQRAISKECAAWIRKKAKFKSNTSKAPMQKFFHIQNGNTASAYMPIDGFTAVDLGYEQGNAVSNYINVNNDVEFTKMYLHLFDQIWFDSEKLDDVTENICNHIETIYQENSPEKIYFLMLYNIFNEFLEDINEDVLPNDLTGYKKSVIWNKLYNFQQDASVGIINKLEKYNGCILADSVGLGKTFTALAVIKYYELRNRSVLVLCPKKLADNWLNFNRNLKTNSLHDDRLAYDVLCHTDLLRTSGESYGTALNRINWGNYDLVVIDESHNFRNNEVFKERETRYQKLMNSVIREGVKTKVLMLSATPVNNRFNDLKNQLALAYEGDSEQLDDKLRTSRDVDQIFRQAQESFNRWSKLPAKDRTAETILNALDFDFFELLDSVTIARSRKHIETFYDTKDIGDFPQRRKPLSFRCGLTDLDNILYNDIYIELSKIKMSVYAPISYILPSRLRKYEELYDTEVGSGKSRLKQADRERSLQSLITTNLLKRLESSVDAFRITLENLKRLYSKILNEISRFENSDHSVNLGKALGDLGVMESEDDDLSGISNYFTNGKIQVDFKDMDIKSWKYDLEHDLEIIKDLYNEMKRITPEHDLKLQHIIEHIQSKVNNPINTNNKKILLFTAFADTANYLYENIAPIYSKCGLHIARVSGSDAPTSTLDKHYDFQSLLTLFSPISKEKEHILPEEPNEIDIMIGTDCISEGQNLQDCDYVINYDIHWNPIRIIQRFGRIDRIGSKNESIQLVNYWPDISLDEYINLKERVESRMVIADITATGDDNVLTAKANDVSYRKEQLRKLQDEVIDMEDLKTGVNITDLGLNDFRMDLLNYIKAGHDLESLPNGLHTVLPANNDIGLIPGVIFVLRNRNEEVNVNRNNRLHPYYLIYTDPEGNVLESHAHAKRLLDLIRSSCKGLNEPVKELYSAFNEETHDGRDMKTYSDLLSTSISSIMDIKEDQDLDSLFTGQETTALENSIKGLDDFELINFFVIRD